MSLSDADRKWITDMVKQQVSIILSGNTAATQVDDVPGTESIDNLFPGCPTVEGRPVAHPFGLVSRAPKGTAQVTARQGEHPANRIVLSHRDKNRPALAAEGDVWLYDPRGNAVKLIDGKIVMKLAGTLELGEGASKGVARINDPVTLNPATLIGALNAAPSPAGTPIVAGMTVQLVLASPTPSAGFIAQGSTKVTAVD